MEKYRVEIHKDKSGNYSLEEEIAYELMFFYRNNGILKDPQKFVYCFYYLQGILKSFRKDFVEAAKFSPIVEDPSMYEMLRRIESDRGESDGAC